VASAVTVYPSNRCWSCQTRARMTRVSGYTKENKHSSAESTRSSARREQVGQSADSTRAISSRFRSAIDGAGALATKTHRSDDNPRFLAKLAKVSSRAREMRIDKSRDPGQQLLIGAMRSRSPFSPISIQAEVNLWYNNVEDHSFPAGECMTPRIKM